MPEPAEDALADRDLLVAAAEEAGEIALRHFRRSPAVTEKPDGQGPVTEADLAVDRALAINLRRARPGYGWLSEETTDGPDRLTAERVLIVDPIDGTRAFIDGQAGWAVAVAVAVRGQITAAVVHLPARGETYAAALNAGATLNGMRLSPSPEAPVEPEILAAKPALAPEHWPGGLPVLKRSFRPSLAWRLCLAASGRFDGMVTIQPTWEWDVASGSLIAAEAGRAVSDADGLPLAFNATPPRTPGVIAAAPALHARLIAARRGPGGAA
ncbi:MAG: 3'(2'),5'-bisphosphate nucleotidase CysQ [Pseudomonadota bacterium]